GDRAALDHRDILRLRVEDSEMVGGPHLAVAKRRGAAALALPRDPDAAFAAVVGAALNQYALARPGGDDVVGGVVAVAAVAVDQPAIALEAVQIAGEEGAEIVVEIAADEFEIAGLGVDIHALVGAVRLDIHSEAGRMPVIFAAREAVAAELAVHRRHSIDLERSQPAAAVVAAFDVAERDVAAGAARLEVAEDHVVAHHDAVALAVMEIEVLQEHVLAGAQCDQRRIGFEDIVVAGHAAHPAVHLQPAYGDVAAAADLERHEDRHVNADRQAVLPLRAAPVKIAVEDDPRAVAVD